MPLVDRDDLPEGDVVVSVPSRRVPQRSPSRRPHSRNVHTTERKDGTRRMVIVVGSGDVLQTPRSPSLANPKNNSLSQSPHSGPLRSSDLAPCARSVNRHVRACAQCISMDARCRAATLCVSTLDCLIRTTDYRVGQQGLALSSETGRRSRHISPI